jgi:uncharacterized damage-inducible protein DinB
VDLQQLRTLVDYHYWARDRLLAAVESLTVEQFVQNMGNSFSSVRDTLVHLLSAETIWLKRWHGQTPQGMLPPDSFPDLASIRVAWTKHESQMRAFMQGLDTDGVNRVIEYRSLAGEPFASVFSHMLQHVVNHASYHRGQVTTMLRQLGVPPPKTMDLINFYRER